MTPKTPSEKLADGLETWFEGTTPSQYDRRAHERF